MGRIACLIGLSVAALAERCDVNDGVQRMIWVHGCKGTGCLANGVDQDCAWCVYDMTGCKKAYGEACEATRAARLAQEISCAASDAIFELDARRQDGPSVVDLKSKMEFGNMPTKVEDGVVFWDLDSATLERSGGGNITERQHYTHAFWLRWRPNATYRTLFHHSKEFPTPDHVGDHCEFTQTHNSQCQDCEDTLGVQCNRASPAWRPTKYQIVTNVWSFVVSVGLGDDDVNPAGITTFYVGYASAPKVVGTADRVCSGMSYDRIGWDASQGPGKLAQVWGWNRTLSADEVAEVYEASRARYYGNTLI